MEIVDMAITRLWFFDLENSSIPVKLIKDNKAINKNLADLTNIEYS